MTQRIRRILKLSITHLTGDFKPLISWFYSSDSVFTQQPQVPVNQLISSQQFSLHVASQKLSCPWMLASYLTFSFGAAARLWKLPLQCSPLWNKQDKPCCSYHTIPTTSWRYITNSTLLHFTHPALWCSLYSVVSCPQINLLDSVYCVCFWVTASEAEINMIFNWWLLDPFTEFNLQTNFIPSKTVYCQYN